MGMDISGLAPTSETGSYFRNSIWWWRQLAAYVIDNCKSFLDSKEMVYWQSNDGQIVSAESATGIGNQLQKLIDSGVCKTYADEYERQRKAVPDNKCAQCKGTGMRNDKIGKESRKHNPKYKCNGCDGTGGQQATAAMYPFSVENVQEFANFCKDSGGFQIY